MATTRSAVEGDRSRIYPHQLHNKENLNTNNVSTAAAVATRLITMVGSPDFGTIGVYLLWCTAAGRGGGRADRGRRQDAVRDGQKLVRLRTFVASRVGGDVWASGTPTIVL